jgi:hypothetical protein
MLDERTTTFSWEDDAAAKTEKTLALAQRLIDWFRDNYEDPAESTPFCSEEGGYMYLCGGPYDAREELAARFAADDGVSVDELDEIIDLAVEEIERDGGDEWAKVLPDDGSEPDEDVIRLLRAHNHYWGKGHVCPSSDDLRHIAGFQKGGSGSSVIEIMRHVVDAASDGWRLSGA